MRCVSLRSHVLNALQVAYMWGVSLGGDEGSQMLARAGLLDQVRQQGPVQLLCMTGSTECCQLAEGAASALLGRLTAARTNSSSSIPRTRCLADI